MHGAGMKDALHDELRWAREAMLWKLDGLTEYDARRPLTSTGTNLLGLVKHLSIGEARYFGDVFGRPFSERLTWWDADAEPEVDTWAPAGEPRGEILDRYRRACEHADATIALLDVDAPGHVPWWPRPEVTLGNVLAHVLAETNRHAGHADILRERLDGSTGSGPDDAGPSDRDDAWWRAHVAKIEEAARAAQAAADLTDNS